MKYNCIKQYETELPGFFIEENRLFNVYVVGLPRSGTSMMMGIIKRLGVNVIATSDTEENLKIRNEKERKRYGDNYQMNKDGFYEITENSFGNYLKVIATPYSGCKMIIPVIGFRAEVLKYQPCKVIQMWRDPEEIRQSQQASYKGDLVQTEEEAELERAKIKTLLAEQKVNLEKLRIPSLDVQYREVLNNTEKEIRKIAKFINSDKDIKEAEEWVNPDKNRFKKENLEKSI